MANIAGSGGGDPWAGVKAAPVARGQGPTHGVQGQTAGPNPITGVIHALLHGTQTPAQAKTDAAFRAAHGGLQGGTVFNPVSLAVDQFIRAPALIRGAHAQAIRIAHPSAENPPSLGQEAKGLLTGAFGLPLLRLKKDGDVAVPRVVKGKTTPETGGDLGLQVREGLRGATKARREQDKLYSAERGSRAARAEKAMVELGGKAGYDAAVVKLKGELPKLKFNGMEHFDQAGIDALDSHIQAHPDLLFFEKIRAQTALHNVLDGTVPTKSGLALLHRVFGREVSNQIVASVPWFAKAKSYGLDALNVPRSLMSSIDMSAPFRQGLVAGAAHPVMFGKNFGPMVKAFGSEKAYQALMEEIASRPTFDLMRESGLALTDLEGLSTREEQFVSNLAERIPIAGRGVRASGRAYVGFLTKMRADYFDYMIEVAGKQGLDVTDKKLTDSVARYINSATGRGDLGALRGHAVTLNTVFFSPRLLASRINFLWPPYYFKLDPFARIEALKAMRNLIGAGSLVLFLAKQAGASVNLDPRNADFGKMRFGNTRIDIWGGFQQPIRLVAQELSGKIISSTTGKTLTLGPQGPGKLSRWDIGQRFIESKFAPVPSFVKDVGKQTDSVGQPLKWDFSARNPLVQRMLPLLAQDVYSLYQQEGLLPALGGATVGAFGVGIQTYGAKPAKQGAAKSNDPWSGASSKASSTDPWSK